MINIRRHLKNRSLNFWCLSRSVFVIRYNVATEITSNSNNSSKEINNENAEYTPTGKGKIARKKQLVNIQRDAAEQKEDSNPNRSVSDYYKIKWDEKNKIYRKALHGVMASRKFTEAIKLYDQIKLENPIPSNSILSMYANLLGVCNKKDHLTIALEIFHECFVKKNFRPSQSGTVL